VLLGAALALSGCIQSSRPVLTGGEQMFGPKLRLQLYGLRDGYARDLESVSFAWNGSLYAHAGGGLKDVAAFSALPFEAGDVIIQTVPAKHGQPTEFAVAHKLAEGVWQVLAIDEADADEATRAALCKKADKTTCTVETREQLLAFARATAAQRKDSGGLAIRLPDDARARKPHH
jgi:hypothetical protein